VEYKAGARLVTSSSWHGMGFVDTPDGRFMLEQLNIGVGSVFTEWGNAFSAFVKNGQVWTSGMRTRHQQRAVV